MWLLVVAAFGFFVPNGFFIYWLTNELHGFGPWPLVEVERTFLEDRSPPADKRRPSRPHCDITNRNLPAFDDLSKRAATPPRVHQFLQARVRRFHLFARACLTVNQ